MWTLANLRRRPFIQRAEEELYRLMRRAGKTRFQVRTVAQDAGIQPFSGGYLVDLDLAHPNCDAVYLHELLHGILLEERYPLAHSERILVSRAITQQALEGCTNSIHHVEIFRRMAEYGADMAQYFARRAEEMRTRFEGIIASDDWQISVRHLDPLVVFDTHFMGHFGEEVRAGYEGNATRVTACCRQASNAVRDIGCQTPERARDSLSAFCREMASLCDANHLQDAYEFWESVTAISVSEKPLAPCPPWVEALPGCGWAPWTWLKRWVRGG